MKMIKQIITTITVAFLMLFFTACKKYNEKNLIKGRLLIERTNLPLTGFRLEFDVASGSGFFGSLERSKYFAVSDENGYFSFRVEKTDIKNSFYLNRNSAWYDCSSSNDIATTQGKYMLAHAHQYIVKDKNTTLYFLPRGTVNFWVPKSIFEELKIDTIIVRSAFDSDTITKPFREYEGIRSGQFYLEPSEVHQFEFIALKNGAIYKKVSKDVYVTHECSHRMGERDGIFDVDFKE